MQNDMFCSGFIDRGSIRFTAHHTIVAVQDPLWPLVKFRRTPRGRILRCRPALWCHHGTISVRRPSQKLQSISILAASRYLSYNRSLVCDIASRLVCHGACTQNRAISRYEGDGQLPFQEKPMHPKDKATGHKNVQLRFLEHTASAFVCKKERNCAPTLLRTIYGLVADTGKAIFPASVVTRCDMTFFLLLGSA